MKSWGETSSSGESSSGDESDASASSEYEEGACTGTTPNDDGQEVVHLPPAPPLEQLVQPPEAAVGAAATGFGAAQPEPEPEAAEGQLSSRPQGIRSANGRLRRGLRIVCAPCQKNKRGCDGAFPCVRCFDANVPCRPVVDSPSGRRRGRRGRRRGQQEDSAAVGVEGAAGLLPPLLDLALSRTDPLPQAEEFLQIFAECHRERPLDRCCALRLVRMWRCMSILMDSDVTWSVAQGICQIMGISASEVVSADDDKGPLARLIGNGRRGGAALGQRLEETRAAIADASARLRESDAFRRAVQAFPASTAVHVGGCDGVLPSYGSTAAWTALMKGGLEIVEDVVARRTTHMLLFPRLLAPCDRPLCYRAVIRAVFTLEARRQVEFVKVFSKVEEPRLYILTVQGTQAVKGGWGLIYALEPMPSSRWITDKPTRAMHGFYVAPPAPPPPPLSPLSGGDVDPNATFPGIASVGVPHRAPSIPPAPFPPQPQPQPQPQWHPPLATARASPAAVRSILQEIYHAPLTIPAGSYDAGGAMEIALSSPPILGEAVLADVFGADKEEKQGGAQHADGGSGGY